MAKSPAGKEEEGTGAQRASASSSSNSEQRTNADMRRSSQRFKFFGISFQKVLVDERNAQRKKS